MSKKTRKPRQSYSPEFKQEAIELAREIGAKEAAEKLGIKSLQTISAWVRYSKKIEEDDSFRELERLKAENKKLKKELEIEKKSVAILRDAAAFFVRNS